MQEDTDVFEITDFTTASDWERFINDFEEILRQWDLSSKGTRARRGKLKPNELSEGTWIEKFETIKFSKAYFTATHYYLRPKSIEADEANSQELPVALEDSVSTTNDFPARAHCIARWYGLREFLVISPAGQTESINSEDKCKLLISSAAIALNNTQSEVPVFVQLNQRQRRLFQGICTSNEVNCHYDMIHFNKTPAPYGYLSELLNLYKEKLGFSTLDCPPVNVTIRFTHVLREWPMEWQYCEHPIDQENPPVEVSQSIDFVCYEEPISELHLSATWPLLSEELVADSPFHSDLDSLHAPRWSLRIKTKENVSSSMYETLTSFFNLGNCPAKGHQILGKLIEDLEDKESDQEVRQALDRITGGNVMSINLPQLGQVRGKWKWHLPPALRSCLLGYIFEDTLHADTDKIDPKIMSLLNDFRTFKSAKFDSLTWRIVLTLAFVNVAYKDLAALAYMWREIISELRKAWEKCAPLPRMDDEPPNQATCLLNQKLQMLNCCIHQKLKRESPIKSGEGKRPSPAKQGASDVAGNGSDDEDEFFDAEDETVATEQDTASESPEAEGRESALGDLTLLKNDSIPLYIPITQEPPPMTEDMLQEHADILFQLGTSSEGAALRAKMQSAGLFSDMEAFKAANPGAVIEDFLRWYSPRDYADGQLSERMLIPGNMWRECWESARALPVARQKRLFDYTKEAEKVLHYLTSFSLEDIVAHFMAVLSHSALSQLSRERDVTVGLTDEELPLRTSDIVKCVGAGQFMAAINLMREAEVKLFQIGAIKRKLAIVHELEANPAGLEAAFDWQRVKGHVLSLVNSPETEVPGAGSEQLGVLVKGLFRHSGRLLYDERTPVGERDLPSMASDVQLPPVLGAPFAKEFILRVKVPRPAVYSRSLPQRMYCCLSPSEFRIAGSFVEDSLYF